MNVFGSGRVATAEDYRKFLKNNKIAAKKLLVATSELKQSRRKSVNSNSYSTEKLGDASELKQSRRKSVNSNSYSTEKLGDASELKQSRRKSVNSNSYSTEKLGDASELKQSRRKSVNSNSYSTEKLGDASELKQSRRKSVNSNSYSTEKLGDASELKQSRRKSVNSNSSLTLLGLNKPPQRFYEKDNPRPRSKSQINASEDLHFYNQESPIRKKSFTKLKSVNTNDTVVISKPRKSIKKQYN
ncbi:protein V57 [Canid alphaherpesvirus 1]|nr:protein V57 [Canid alphaherpesvirus 1]